MYRKWLAFSTLFLFISLTLSGYLIFNDNSDTDPYGSRTINSSSLSKLSKKEYLEFFSNQSDNNSNIRETFGSVYYQDNFDGANDTTSLKNRGYKVFYRSGGPQGIAPTWFQGNQVIFSSFNGPANGYLAAVYQVLSSANNIDNWLILPKNNTASGDSIIFYSRSVPNSVYPDSVRVMFSSTGDSIPEGSWTELGRYKASTDGSWERKAFGVTSSGVNARFAIRYNVVNGGPGGVNSDYIGIDALTLESNPGANDISSITVDVPNGTVSLPTSTIAPKATFKNVGTSPQTNIPVTYKITGPVNYTSNKVIASLSSDSSVQTVFDNTFNPVPGNYNVTVYSSLAADGNRFNDTVKFAFTAVNLNYGNSASYFYSNSTIEAIPAPSQPQFCWKDTTGSTSLEVNSVNSIPGITTGNLDDGYWKFKLPDGKKIKFFGTNYDTIRIGTNGIISFQNYDPFSDNWNPPLSGIPGGNVPNAIYPLWNDLDFSNLNTGPSNRISYKVNGNFLLVTFDRAPVYSGEPGNYVSFQIELDISTAPVSNSRILFQYSDTTLGKTGQPFVTNVNTNNFGRHLVGIQNSSSTLAMTYRFRNSNTVVTPGRIFDPISGSLALQYGPDASQLNSACNYLDLTGRLELIQLSRKDTLKVSLRTGVSPFSIVETKKAVYDSLNGAAHFQFFNTAKNTPYYIFMEHRNSISTWSAEPVIFTGNSINYDFSTGLSKAFGNNMKIVNGKSSFYSGEVVKNGCIDLADIIQILNETNEFTSGPYVLEDLNFDGLVDLTDLVSCLNNSSAFVCEIAP